jgi:formylglycine-generating enzyme required for sulfatase activity
VAEIQLLSTEMPQSLYLQVMRANPSRNAGRAYPVDSVNWFEAVACCERLSWIMGRVVRLPTEDEYRIAVGDPMTGDLGKHESSAGSVSAAMADREPNRSGYFDLLGNLAEWLTPRPDQSPIWSLVAGGSFLDGPALLRSVPSVPTERTERARHIGFRVVVELPED